MLLLEMNKESPLLKLSLDSGGDVILLAEVMQNQLSEDNFFNLIFSLIFHILKIGKMITRQYHLIMSLVQL